MRIMRGLVLNFLVWAALFPGLVSAQDAKLVDAAKKEGGKVVIYGSLENDAMDLIAAAWKKKTGLRTSIPRPAP